MHRPIGWGTLAVLAWLTVAAPAGAVVVINEVLADPAGDADGDGVVSIFGDEFVELLNAGASPVSLQGWTLSDALHVRHTFGAADQLSAGQLLAVFGSTASSGMLSLNNTAETVSLRDGSDALVAQLVYGSEGNKNASLARQPDGTGPFVLHDSIHAQAFSPGKTLEGLSVWPLALPPAPVPWPELPPELPSLPQPSEGPVVPEPGSWLLLGAGLPFLKRRFQRCDIMNRFHETLPHHSLGVGAVGRRGAGDLRRAL